MDLNVDALIKYVKDGVELFKPALSTVVGALMTVMFLRRNTETTEFEKIKKGHFEQVIEDLYKNNLITNLEIARCKNFIQVARLAEKIQHEKGQTRPKGYTVNDEEQAFDFDWFLRFFDAVGNISNADMQVLWASVLAGEVEVPGSFSLRTIETLRNMTKQEAMLFKKIAKMALIDVSSRSIVVLTPKFVGKSDFDASFHLALKEFLVLFDCGILNPQSVTNFDLDYALCNDNVLLKLRNIGEVNESFKYNYYTLTQAAIQLLSVVDEFASNQYILELGAILKKKYRPQLEVNVFKILESSGDKFVIDDEVDLLNNYAN